jgi:hypothetical protein
MNTSKKAGWLMLLLFVLFLLFSIIYPPAPLFTIILRLFLLFDFDYKMEITKSSNRTKSSSKAT